MFNVVLYFRLLKEGDIYTISFDFFDNYGKSDRFKHLIFKRIFQNSSKMEQDVPADFLKLGDEKKFPTPYHATKLLTPFHNFRSMR